MTIIAKKYICTDTEVGDGVEQICFNKNLKLSVCYLLQPPWVLYNCILYIFLS